MSHSNELQPPITGDLIQQPQPQEPMDHRFIRLLDRMSEDNPLTPEAMKDQLAAMTDEQFKRWLLLINGTCRQQVASVRKFDGEGFLAIPIHFYFGDSEIKVDSPPETADRLPLMLETFHAAQQVHDPAVAGLLLTLGVNLTHLFADGNGRTGRMIHALFRDGYDGSEAVRLHYIHLLDNETGREYSDIHIAKIAKALRLEYAHEKKRLYADKSGYTGEIPYILEDTLEGMDYMPSVEEKFLPPNDMWYPDYWLDYSPGLSNDARNQLRDIIKSPPVAFRDIAMFQWLLQTNQTGLEFINYVEELDATLIAYRNILYKGLTDKDVTELAVIYRDIKRDFVRYALSSAVECYGEDPGIVTQAT